VTVEDRTGIPFVVAAPSGTGKTTLCRRAMERDALLEFSVSHTTRAPRPGEADGVDYYFVSGDEFAALVERGEFVEHAVYGKNSYGTSDEALRVPIEERGHDVLVEIEVQGAQQLRQSRRDARFIFLLPPDMRVLAQRLRDRATDSPEAIAGRLEMAERELGAVVLFDYVIVNDDLEQAIDSFLEIIHAERAGTVAALAAVAARHGREAVMRRWSPEPG
jgi:guanylate kinase